MTSLRHITDMRSALSGPAFAVRNRSGLAT
jgi:hypothetical protein